MDKKPLVKESTTLLNIWGLNPLNNRKHLIIKSYLALIVISIYNLEVCLGLFKKLDTKMLLYGTAAYIASWQSVVKAVVLISQRKNIASLLKIMHSKYWKLETLSSNLQAHSNNIYKLSRRLMMGAIILYWATVIFNNVNPTLIKKRILPIPLYHFMIDNISFPAFIFCLLYKLVTMLLVTSPIFLGFDFLLGSIIIYHINELFLIKERFLLVAQSGLEKNNLAVLRKLIDHQNLVLSCISKTNAIFARYFFILFFTNIFTTCLGLISIASERFPPNYGNVAQALVTLMFFLSVIFLYCFLGTLLTTEAENIGNAAYNSDWLKENNIELRRNLILIIQRSQNITKLSAGPLMDLNLESFGRVIGAAFNFFTLAKALFNK